MLIEPMEILHFTDIHGTYALFETVHEIIGKADLIILSGDITHFGHEKETQKIIESISRYNSNILAVAGNCDYPEVETYLDITGIGLHLKSIDYGGFVFAGIGGSLPCPGKTPYEYTEEELSVMIQKLSLNIGNEKPLILISHQPPLDTINDRLSDGSHVGSRAVREFIKNRKPALCLTGHIHEGTGTDSIGASRIVNPGPFRSGNFARIICFGHNSIEINLLRTPV